MYEFAATYFTVVVHAAPESPKIYESMVLAHTL